MVSIAVISFQSKSVIKYFGVQLEFHFFRTARPLEILSVFSSGMRNVATGEYPTLVATHKKIMAGHTWMSCKLHREDRSHCRNEKEAASASEPGTQK